VKRTLSTVAVLVLLAAAAATAGCASATASGGATKVSGQSGGVVLRVGDQKAGSEPLLAAAGLLDNTPYRIEWSQFSSGPPLLEAVNAGAIDVGGVGDTPPIFAASSGSRIVLVAASLSKPTGSAILVRKSSPITDLAALKGKKIAVAKGSSSNAHLLNALKKAGLTFADITPAYLQPADALAAFTNGSVDAWAIWDPYTAIAQQTADARILADGTGLLSGLAFQVAAPAALNDPKKVAALRDYLGRLSRARDWVRSHPDQWAAAWAKEAGIPLAAAKIAVARADQRTVVIDDNLLRAEQQTADAFADAGLIPTRVSVKNITDTRFNDTVTASGGSS
jgi:sulfonate transport system substrate-binding protein